jgi:ribosomal protein S18 acetylase RimI-like enzyme
LDEYFVQGVPFKILIRQGYGRQIMDALHDHAKQMQGETWNPNCRVLLSAIDEDAASFYTKLGYEKLREGPIPNGECLMCRDISGPGLELRKKSS